MRIGIDIKAFKNGTTGIARYLRSIMDVLQQIDRDNDYLLFSCSPSEYAITNYRWKKIITPWPYPGILWQQLVLPGLLKKFGIDLLWAPEQICPILGRRTTKIVTTVHDLAFLRYPKTCQRSNRWIQTLLFPPALIRSSVLAPVSEYIGREVRRSYARQLKKTRIECVYNGGPRWFLPIGYIASDRRDFLFFPGNLEPRKNLPRLIRALELLAAKDGLHIPLHLAGPAGWHNSSLFSMLENSPIKDAVSYLGYVSEEDLQRQYLSCKALVYPSLYEGFGLPLLEAFSLDCTVLTSKGTVMQEIAGDAALYFDPESIESIAASIKHLYDPGFDRRVCLRNGLAIVEKYSWEKSAGKLLETFVTVMKQAPRV